MGEAEVSGQARKKNMKIIVLADSPHRRGTSTLLTDKFTG